MQAYTSINTGSENALLVIASGMEVSIKGDGRDSSILDITLDDSFYSAIAVNGVNGITIEDIAITGTGTAYSSGYGGGIRILLSSRVTVKNCYFADLRGNAYISLGNNSLVAGNTGVNYYCTYNIFKGNTVRNVTGDGTYNYWSKYAHVSDNTYYNVGYTDSILFEGSDHSTCSNNTILEPILRGILVNTGSGNTTVTGNTIFLSDPAVGGDGIYLASVRYCNVMGNIISYEYAVGTPATAIATIPGLFDYQDAYHNISNNNIYNAGSSTTVPAILLQTDYNTFEGNKIQGGTYGMLVDNSDYNIIINNHFIEVEGQSIRINDEVGNKPDHTYVVNNHLNIDLYDDGTNTYIADNFPTNLAAVAATSAVMDIVTKHYKSVTLDSTAGAITLTVGSGSYIGQVLTIVMIEASASSTVTVTNHDDVAGDPAIVDADILEDGPQATFNAVDETWVLMWTGTEWTTLRATCTFV